MNQQHQWSNASQARLQATPAGVERFRKDRLGVSVHFGLYSIDGQKEWHQCLEKIPRDVYARQLGRFNPHQFNAQEWIDEFVEAGATAFMVTTKHHDGFCLFDSELTDFTSTHAPFRRDLIAELAEACHRRKVALHLYYSLIDWHHPQMSSVHFEPAADFAAYCQYMPGADRGTLPQLRFYRRIPVRRLVAEGQGGDRSGRHRASKRLAAYRPV